MHIKFLRRIKGLNKYNLNRNSFYLVTNQSFILTDKQLMSIKNIKYKLNYKILINLNIIKTKKSSNSRMGAGKGNPDTKVQKIKKHTPLISININSKNLTKLGIKNILRTISFKLPIKTYILELN